MKLTDIFVYPLKSANRVALSEVEVTLGGLRLDRNYAVINSKNEIITAREDANLLSLDLEITDNAIYISSTHDRCKLSTLKIQNPITVSLFDEKKTALELKNGSDWISNYLGYSARFIKIAANNSNRNVSSLMDDSPIHLVNQKSLDDLNHRLEYPVKAQYFRPNLITNGFEAYEEETWSKIKIGNCFFEVLKKCSRCSITTIDPITGIKNKEPLKTLATYKKENTAVTFGVYLKPLNEGQILLGDTVEIIEMVS